LEEVEQVVMVVVEVDLRRLELMVLMQFFQQLHLLEEVGVEQEHQADHNLKEMQVDLVVEMVEMQEMEQVEQVTHLLQLQHKELQVVEYQEQIPMMVAVEVEQVLLEVLVPFNKEELVELV
tara:strand:- start:44 stop:406 length:363 start_codon:yes stop_codon:yes gene_type:complete